MPRFSSDPGGGRYTRSESGAAGLVHPFFSNRVNQMADNDEIDSMTVALRRAEANRARVLAELQAADDEVASLGGERVSVHASDVLVPSEAGNAADHISRMQAEQAVRVAKLEEEIREQDLLRQRKADELRDAKLGLDNLSEHLSRFSDRGPAVAFEHKPAIGAAFRGSTVPVVDSAPKLSSVKIKVKAPSTFDDSWRDEVRIDSWIRDMQGYLRSQGLASGQPHLFSYEYDVIRSYLSDVPKNFLDGYLEVASWGAIKILRTLRERYVSASSKDELLLRWEKFSRDYFFSKKRNLHEIGMDLDSHHRLLGPENVTSIGLRRKFMQCIPADLALRMNPLIELSTISFNQLVDLAVSINSKDQLALGGKFSAPSVPASSGRRQGQPSSGSSSQPVRSGSSQDEPSAVLRSRIGRWQQRYPPGSALPEAPADMDASKVTCYNCLGKGHFAQSCRKPRVQVSIKAVTAAPHIMASTSTSESPGPVAVAADNASSVPGAVNAADA
jgi:hypothetical protein